MRLLWYSLHLSLLLGQTVYRISGNLGIAVRVCPSRLDELAQGNCMKPSFFQGQEVVSKKLCLKSCVGIKKSGSLGHMCPRSRVQEVVSKKLCLKSCVVSKKSCPRSCV